MRVKGIKEFDMKYGVTDCGKILNLIWGTEKKPQIVQRYLQVNFEGYGAKKVHRLVAEYFIGNRAKHKTQINHIDGNKLNNHYTNLEWCTVSENHLHAFRTGLRTNKGVKNPLNKLDDEKVREIRKLISVKTPLKIIAKKYGVSLTTISAIKCNRTWTHVR